MKISMIVLLCALLPGCNVVRGVGQDMAAVGRTLTKVAGTGEEHHASEPATGQQPFDPSYHDQSYLQPDPVATE
ncbi:MAG: hypothetical protein ACKO39_13845 [Chthoniobacterales bacterium]